MGAMQAAFVKFFGRAGTRTAWDAPVLDVLARTGAHWAGTYPAGRRPRSVRDGDRMFMAQLVARGGEADIAVFGRALALAYVEGRDDADEDDLALRPWKARWPHYIRVRDGEFLSGTHSAPRRSRPRSATRSSAEATPTRARPIASSRRCDCRTTAPSGSTRGWTRRSRAPGA
jgi:hypothetical protein